MKFLIYILILVAHLNASNKVGEQMPCDHPLLELAELEGIKAIPIKDIFKLKKLMKECENDGGVKRVDKIYEKDWNRDYNSARRMSSWTSTHAMCVFVSFAYYFAGKMFATVPSS